MSRKGFTLIELLVVIAIIGLLSSIVMASIASARIKARETSFKRQMIEFRNTLELEKARVNSYAALNTSAGWGSSDPNNGNGQVPCDTLYPPNSSASPYMANANTVCKKLVEISGPNNYSMYVAATENTYSINGWFGPTNLLYCVGSSGMSDALPWEGVDSGGTPIIYTHTGCIYNP